MAGLSFPCGLTVAEDGTIFIAEGGTTWPTRPWLPSRLLRLSTSGDVDLLAVERGGRRSWTLRKRRLCLRNGERWVRLAPFEVRCHIRRTYSALRQDAQLWAGIRSAGGPVFGPDGLIYFAQGSVAQQGHH